MNVVPAAAPHAAAHLELDQRYLGLMMGNNMMLSVSDMHHTHPEGAGRGWQDRHG